MGTRIYFQFQKDQSLDPAFVHKMFHSFLALHSPRRSGFVAGDKNQMKTFYRLLVIVLDDLQYQELEIHPATNRNMILIFLQICNFKNFIEPNNKIQKHSIILSFKYTPSVMLHKILLKTHQILLTSRNPINNAPNTLKTLALHMKPLQSS